MITAVHPLDAAIIVVYLAMLAGVGVSLAPAPGDTPTTIFSPRQSMTWLPVGLSLMAALNSGMDYLMQPSSTIQYGLVLAAGIFSWLVLYPWVAKVAFPFFHRLNYFTVYEYLEARFDVRVRTLARRHLHPLASGLDGDRDVCSEPGDQRRQRRRRGPHPDDDHRRRPGDAVHDARRHRGRDLERRAAVLHHVRRAGGHGRHRVVQRAGRPAGDLGGRRGGGKLDCVRP